jgi:hypothetical protein
MPSVRRAQRRTPAPQIQRRRRSFFPSLVPLDQRVVPSLFPGINGITFDTSGDVFISYDSTTLFSGQQQSVAAVAPDGLLINPSVFSTTGASAFPGALTTVGPSASLPMITNPGDILELQPNGQLFVLDPTNGTSSQYDNLQNYTANASKVFNVQTQASTNLTGQISLGGATYGDFGIYNNSLVVSAESHNWDFVLRLTYGSAGGVATVLAASPASDDLSASPEGVAVDSKGTVLTTLPFLPVGSPGAIHVPVGFSLTYDQGGSPAPYSPALGLKSVPDIDSSGITLDSQNNFILAVTTTSLYGGGPGVAHVNAALKAFLADPLPDPQAVPTGIACQTVNGSSFLAFGDATSETDTVAGELPLFSGQVTPNQLRQAYGVNQISFTAPGGRTVTGDGSGQTIAIVEEGVDPTLQSDLTTFDQFFNIAAPPNFTVVDQNGVTTLNDSIVGEASLDVEWAHAIAPGASIVVYNAAYEPTNSAASFQNLMEAMGQAAAIPGVSVVTLSYGLPENALASLGFDQQTLDGLFTTPGVTFVAASGDSGIFGNGGFQIAANYPSASPNVVSVGGTSIVIDAAGDYPGTGSSGEVAWGSGANSGNAGGGGGGLSSVEPEPLWQQAVVPQSVDPLGTRALPDVSMDSGAAQEYDVFASTLSGSANSPAAVGWLRDAGTSAASPIWAGLIAIADQGRALAGAPPLTGNTQTLPALYSLPRTDFHDIVNGNNGDPAGPGYDLATGLGTPVANLLVPDLARYGLPSKMTIKTEPPSSVFVNGTFALTVQVQDSAGNPITGGTATVALGSVQGNPTLGGKLTQPVINGLATFTNLTLSQPGIGDTLVVTDSNLPTSLTTTGITVKAGGPPLATLTLSDPSFTYDGAPHFAVVSTIPAGLSGVTITYADNGVPVTSPTQAGVYAVTATLNNPGFTAQPVTGTLIINQASPTLVWNTPASIIAGTPLGAGQLDAVAVFNGALLPGVFVYTPSAGTVLPVGNGQILTVGFAPLDSTDFKVVTSAVMINASPQAPPQVVTIIGEQPVFAQKLNKKAKPSGKSVLTGFTLDFSAPLDAAIASSAANFQFDTITTKRVKAKIVRVLEPINFTVAYSPATDSVTLRIAGIQAFTKGGQITILPGVTGSSGSVLGGVTAFAIAPGGKAIGPA